MDKPVAGQRFQLVNKGVWMKDMGEILAQHFGKYGYKPPTLTGMRHCYIYTHTYIHTCIHIGMYVCMHVYLCMHACMHVCMYNMHIFEPF
jgi:hypothetical protein